MPHSRALIVGVSNYSNGFTSLPGVSNDARAVRDLLQSDESEFSSEIVYLTDRKATKAAVDRQLRSFLAESESDDTVFVFIAGHGGKLQDEFYFLPVDAERTRPVETMVSLRKIKELFDESKCTRLIVWLDFCQSAGVLARGADDLFESTMARGLAMVGKGKFIYAACLDAESAHEDPAVGHGWFTEALIRGLKGEADNGRGEVTASSLYDFVCEEVQKRAKSKGVDQMPVMHGTAFGKVTLIHRGNSAARPVGSPESKGQSVANSGMLCMLGKFFYKVKSVQREGGKFVVELVEEDPLQAAPLKDWSKRAFGSHATEFAFQNEGCLVDVDSATQNFSSDGSIWTVKLTPQARQSHMHDVNVSGGQGRSFTGDDIAQMRADRILLDSKQRLESFVEHFVTGGGAECPFPHLYQQHSNHDTFLSRARLVAIFLLQATNTVETIVELILGPIKNGKMRVKFVGTRASYGRGARLSVDGECALSGSSG